MDKKSFCNINVIHNGKNMTIYRTKYMLKDEIQKIEDTNNINFKKSNYNIQLWSLEECLSYCDYLNLDLIIK